MPSPILDTRAKTDLNGGTGDTGTSKGERLS